MTTPGGVELSPSTSGLAPGAQWCARASGRMERPMPQLGFLEHIGMTPTNTSRPSFEADDPLDSTMVGGKRSLERRNIHGVQHGVV